MSEPRTYPDVAAFYADNRARERSPEVDFGVMWTADGGWPHYRVSWVEVTGEFYAVCQAKPATVELLGRAETREQADHVMDGWAHVEPQRLYWVRSRIRLRDPELEASKNFQEPS